MKISCIVPDLHLRWQVADRITKSVGADEYIFLGDFFDDFGDSPEAFNEMIDWLEGAVQKKNFHFIYGNHDVHYAFPERHWRCSGYAQWKHFIVHDRLPMQWFERYFKFYKVLDGKWLLSHAGLHNFNLPAKIADLHEDRPRFFEELTTFLDAEIIKGHRDDSWIFHAGFSRGGTQRVGGLDWCDFEREFYPVRGLNQIVGHTPQLVEPKWCCLKGNSRPTFHPVSQWSPKSKDYDNVNHSYNVDLDVIGNTHWAIWDGKQLRFFNVTADL